MPLPAAYVEETIALLSVERNEKAHIHGIAYGIFQRVAVLLDLYQQIEQKRERKRRV